MRLPLHRRDAFRATMATLAAPVLLDDPGTVQRGFRAFRLVETAGLRRFAYPLATVVPDAAGGRNFRLVRDGRTIPAQFRQGVSRAGQPVVSLDFVASPGPMEWSRYEVHFGSQVEPGPEPRTGVAVESRAGDFLVAQSEKMRFVVAADRLAILREVGDDRLGYLQPDSPGFSIRFGPDDASPANRPKIGVKSAITRQGPLAVGLRHEWTERDAASTLELTFPQSKSWLQAVWTVADPRGIVAGLTLDLNLRVEKSPTLVDFGAGTTVYGQLGGREQMELVAGRAAGETQPEAGTGWVVRRGEPGNLAVQAAATATETRPAEGWAHVMDARRCVAVAISGFGRSHARDKIAVDATGRLRLTRDYADRSPTPVPGPKSFAFWLHFVPMPVQVGAATSPQSILSPPAIEWDR